MGDEGMAGSISKGPVHRKIDRRIRIMTKPQRQRFANDLRDKTKDYFVVLANHGVNLTNEEENYLREKWYIQPGPPPWEGWWQDQQPILPIIREGLAVALEKSIAVTPRLPVDSYWMTGGVNAKVQVFIAVGSGQVTRIIYTPPSDTPGNKPRAHLVDIWVLKEGQETADEVELKYEDAVVYEDPIAALTKRIVRWRRREFHER